MAKNLIPEIAKMLGVEIGEEFKIKGVDKFTYKFDSDKLMVTCYDNMETTAIVVSGTFAELLSGESEIVKLPWKPKKGETYYTFELLGGKWMVHLLWWAGTPNGYALLDKGWVFLTREEAAAALPKVAAEMGVEYEL